MYHTNYHYRGTVEVPYLAARVAWLYQDYSVTLSFLTCFNHFCYGEKAKSGGMPEETIKRSSNRPEFKIPDAGPKAAKVTAATAAPSKVFEPSIPDYNERVFTLRGQ